MQCQACEQENPPGARFCMHCAVALVLACEGCGAALPAGARFCPQCARPVEGSALGADGSVADRDVRTYTPKHLADGILQSKLALEGERKHVTVLFADIPDSVALAELIGPDEMHALMDRCFERILAEVHRYEGTLNQFTGDGVMALFGAPRALEDAPRRALLAALAVQRALEPLSEEVLTRYGRQLRMRMGIDTGLVVVGKIGDHLRMDYTAIGDTTNLANRLQSLAEPGAILISEATERQVRGFFELRDLGGAEIKGRSEPVRVFEVLAARSVSGRLEAVASTELTRFVGRERELDTLHAAFETARGGHGQVAFIVGEAGLGKSRMLNEFGRRLGDEPHVWVQGHCNGLARTTPFAAMVDLLRRSFGIEDRDDDVQAAAKVADALAELGADLDWTLPLVNGLLSLPVTDPAVVAMDAATRRSETVRALQAHFVRAAEREPLVLVVEDLHWIDTASEELLGYLADSIPASQVLLIFTHRPGYQHPFGDRSYHVRISLQPLSKDEMASMAEALLEEASLPEALDGLIAEKAEGNPFFVEEVTKSLLEQGILRLRDGVLELQSELADIGIPDSIQDVLMARLDRLADRPKRAIQVASVIGRDFALRLLERISEAGEAVHGVVDELRALELILQKAVYPELAFFFKHALTHDVAYESILLPRRRELHRIVAAAIEELYSDRLAEHYEALAHHFTEGEEWRKAFRYLERAAEKAAATWANQAAAEHCRRALEIAAAHELDLSRSELRALEERLAKVSFFTSDLVASGEAYERAAELADDTRDRALNLGQAGYSYYWAHAYDQFDSSIDRTLSLSREHGVREGEGQAILLKQLMTTTLDGDLEAFERESARGLQLAEGSDEILALGCTLAGEAAEWSGAYEQAKTREERALELSKRVDRPYAIAAAWFLGKSLCCRGEYAAASRLLHEEVERMERLGERAHRTRFLNTLGWCYAEAGDHDRAAEFNHRSVVLAEEMLRLDLVAGVPELLANGAINLAINHLARGKLAEAEEAIAPIRSDIDRPGDPWMRWRYTLHLEDVEGRLALARKDPERALELAETEFAAARKFRSRKIEARALELRGRSLLALDRREEAERTLKAAVQAAEAIGHPPVRWPRLPCSQNSQGETAQPPVPGSWHRGRAE